MTNRLNDFVRPLRVLSLGAGVQSSTIALMMKHGEIEPCDCAVFADTKAEPKRVYVWLDWLEKQLPFPVYREMQGEGLTANIEKGCGTTRASSPPLFTLKPDGTVGQINRQCTGDYKLAPITRKVNELRGKRKLVTVIGFSYDERRRCRLPNRKYILKNEWPLIERQMTRRHCIDWMHKHFYMTPPRSACVYCPYKCDAEWRILKDSDPEGWAEAVRMDKLMRTSLSNRRLKYPAFVHRSCVPLDEVDLSTEFDHGQMAMPGILDCEGMCGV